jgi:hypothetical protein
MRSFSNPLGLLSTAMRSRLRSAFPKLLDPVVRPAKAGREAAEFPGIIWVNPNADGYGWFIDPGSTDDSAFIGLAQNPAANHIDLLSVMAHELGHILPGMDESSLPNDLMTEALPMGVRRMPTPYDLGLQPSVGWASSHTFAGLKERVRATDDLSIRLLDGVFAVGLQSGQSGGETQGRGMEPRTSMPKVIPLMAGEVWSQSRRWLIATDSMRLGNVRQEMADRAGYALEEALVDQPVHKRVR